ncbi:MAG TPA: hypothetical protein VFW10_14090 [Steroidobacteraceae bacterium]|nr:hypothetical protein [Steroidobacteraceae bacterium]
MTIYLSDFKRLGFRRSQIIPFLKEHGIDIENALEAIQSERAHATLVTEAAPAEPATPDWRVLVTTWNWLNIDQCAHVMLDQNPIVDYGLNYYDNADDWRLWRQTLQEACTTIYPDRELRNMENKGVFQISPTDLIEWSQRNGYRCPLIPPGDPLPTTHAALKAEVERLRGELAKASTPPKEAEYLDPTHPRYAPELAAAVRVWCAVSGPAPRRTVKQTILGWLEANEPAVDSERVATVANWYKKGGPAKALG